MPLFIPARVQELAVEKQEMRQTQRELKRQHLQLTRDKAAKERLLSELEARAHDVQVHSPCLCACSTRSDGKEHV